MSAANKLSLAVQYADARLRNELPRARLRHWVQAALLGPAELTVRLVAADEGRALNRDYSGKDYATNVLTFAYSENEVGALTQADIILCSDVLASEAKQQQKSIQAHAAHLVVHGVLHAQGYDHGNDAQAAEMEAIETRVLSRLGFADPYCDQPSPRVADGAAPC